MSLVPPVIIPAAIKQTATIIFLHGLGDTGHGWASEIAEIKPKHAKLICPTAPTQPVTINGGFEMPAWYDIRSLDKTEGNEDEQGIKKSVAYVSSLIDQEVSNGIPANRIVLGGFSQGAAVSIYTGLTGSVLLGGLVILSGYLPIRKTINWDSVKKPPILQCHGDADEVVHYAIGQGTSKHLMDKAKIPDYTFKTYKNMGHHSTEQEMIDVANFINKCLPPLTS